MYAQNQTLNLPIPNDAEVERSLKLIEHLKKNSPMPFQDFMYNCLYYKQLGYYTNDFNNFGAQGDFITAPEISKIFSYCIANFISKTKLNTILEIGAGSGKMALNILHFLKKNTQYIIVEISKNLQQKQKKLIEQNNPEYLKNITWLDQVPKNFNGIIIANELLDAMPINRYLIKNNVCHQQFVTFDNKLKYIYKKHNNAFVTKIKKKYSIKSDYIIENNTFANNFVSNLEKKINSGICLFIDYGFLEKEFFHPNRNTGTLMCNYRHRNHVDPLIYPGLQDITAHVNFSEIIHSLPNSKIINYTTQAKFLIDSDINSILQKNNLSPQEKHGINTILSPTEMGDICKVLITAKNYDF